VSPGIIRKEATRMKTSITIRSNGTEYPVSLDEQQQEFTVTLHGEIISAASLARLRQKLDAVPKARLHIPFHEVSYAYADQPQPLTLAEGVITGLSARSRDVLVRWPDGATGARAYFSAQKFMPALSRDDRAELERLIAAANEACRAVAAFTRAHRADLWAQAQASARSGGQPS
jgi:hypothetical protein